MKPSPVGGLAVGCVDDLPSTFPTAAVIPAFSPFPLV
jgi:hypothetical protein